MMQILLVPMQSNQTDWQIRQRAGQGIYDIHLGRFFAKCLKNISRVYLLYSKVI